VLFGYLAQVTFDFEEAARLEGASPWRTIAEVILPMNAPGVVATAIIVFVMNWNRVPVPCQFHPKGEAGVHIAKVRRWIRRLAQT
jgi:ABC-type glycerol-3-phosphate transport system permease component